MNKIILFIICSSLCQIAYSQNEKLEIEGALIIGNNEEQNPKAGTIRWTGKDFEGFYGTEWKSLTNCSADEPCVEGMLDCGSTNVRIFVRNPTTGSQGSELTSLSGCQSSYIILNWIGECGEYLGDGTYPQEWLSISNGIGSQAFDTYLGGVTTRYVFTPSGNNVSGQTVDFSFGVENPNGVMIRCPFSLPLDVCDIASECMTFAEIRASGRAENCYEERNPGDYVDSHLAEFLWLNPTVANWSIDETAKVICAVPDPVPSSSAVLLPPPSGGDDSNMLENVINSNANGEVVGQGVYKIGSTIDINVPIKIFDVPSKLIGNVTAVWDVNVSNIEFYNSIIDAQQLPTARDGWRVSAGADNFVLTRSGIENIYHINRSTAYNAHGVLIQGGNNFRITCNKFNNLINDSDAMRAIRLSSMGNNNIAQPRGDVANNESIDLQARPLPGDPTIDPEFFVTQGFTGSNGRVRVMANRCIDAGKRLSKWQHPDGFVGSNYNFWRNPHDVWGYRSQKHIVNCQIDGDRVTAVNNRIKITGAGRWGNLLEVSPERNDRTFRDIHFNCNDIELLDPPGATHYARGIAFKNKDATSSDTRNQLVNCSARNNVFHGPGGTNHIFAFEAGYDDDASSLDIDLSGNTVNTNVVISVFRGSSAPLPQ